MTQHVRAGYRRHRKGTWLATLVALVTGVLAALAIALPAGATDTQFPPPSSPGNVMPVGNPAGGDTFACSSVRQGGYEIDVPNPRSGTTTYTLGGKAVSLTLVVANTPNSVKDKYFSFKLTGAAATHVAVKGGNHVALYTYSGTNFGPATADGYGSGTPGVSVDTTTNADKTDGTGLHPPLQSDGTPFGVSYTTFCVDLVASISGTVYTDTNANGSLDTGETGIVGRNVSITPSGGAAQTTQTGQSGSYSFTVPTGNSYTICAAQDASQAQTQPTGSVSCKNGVAVSSGAVDAGYQTGSLTGGIANENFGFTGGATGTCDGSTVTAPTTTGGDYSATFVGSPKCTSAVDGQKLVFTTWQTASNVFASLHPANAPTVTCDVSTGTNCVRVNETLHVNLPPGAPQKVLSYDDTLPYTNFVPMPFCKEDPATPNASLTDILPQGNTSCLVDSTSKLVNGTSGWSVDRTDHIFSAQDGGRSY